MKQVKFYKRRRRFSVISIMRFLFIILILLSSPDLSAQANADILVINGRILDGTGNSWFYGSVAIKDGRILKMGNINNIVAAKTIDAKGMIVCPGFIDVHTHIEGDEFRNPTANNFILDGVTTVVTGNCGSSNVDIRKYLSRIDSLRLSINVATLIGHNDVRKAVLGTANRQPTESEMSRMKTIVEEGMKSGAVGFSTGLIYIPGTYSTTNEVVELAKVAAKYKGIYA